MSKPSTLEPSDNFKYNPLDPVPSRGGAMLGPRAGLALQNSIEDRLDVLVYSTDILDKEKEITGPIKLILKVSTDAPQTDFTAKLVDVYPNGSAYNISSGILRQKFTSNDNPSEIVIELWPTSIVIGAGHRIRLEISSSDFPRYDRNPNTNKLISSEKETRIANQTVYHDMSTTSKLILPLIPR